MASVRFVSFAPVTTPPVRQCEHWEHSPRSRRRPPRFFPPLGSGNFETSAAHGHKAPGGGPRLRKWSCPSCGRIRATAFCPGCGEEPLRPRDLSLRGYDRPGSCARSAASTGGWRGASGRCSPAPGALSEAHVAGRRRAFLGPLQIFFLANAIFFAVQSLTQFNIFSSTLNSHLNQQDWAPIAQSLVADRLAAKGTTLAAFAPGFDRAAILNAKALIILMALAFVPLLPASVPRRAPALRRACRLRAASLRLHPAALLLSPCCWRRRNCWRAATAWPRRASTWS